MSQPSQPYPNYPSYPTGGGLPYPGMKPTEGGGEPPPSGGTGITAGVLAVLGGLALAVSAWVTFSFVDFTIRDAPDNVQAQVEALFPGWFDGFTVAVGICAVVASLLLLVGSLLLLMRNGVGRWMVVGGSIITIGIAVAWLVALPGLDADVEDALQRDFGQSLPDVATGSTRLGLIFMVYILPAVVTLVLALIPPTGRWIDAARRKPLPASTMPPSTMPPPFAPPPGQW